MTDKERNTEAAAPTRPLAVGERVLLVSQPTLAQLGTLGAFVQKRLAAHTPLSRLVNDPAFKLLPVAAQVAAATEAAKVQVSGDISPDSFAGTKEAMTPDVCAFPICLLTRPNHPELKLEDVRPHVTEENAAGL